MIDSECLDYYHEKSLIKNGTFGNIYLAIDILTNQEVVIKHVSKEHLNGLVESDILSDLHHPNIIRILATFENSIEVRLVLEKAPRGDLFDYIDKIKADRGLDHELTKEIFRQLVSAVSYIHLKEYVHLDIKLENILLFDDGVRLCDFGLSQKYIPGKKSVIKKGSTTYAAPEIIFANEMYPTSADIWSLGVVLYAMIYMQLPINVDNTPRLAHELYRTKGLTFHWKIPEDLMNLLKGMLHPFESQRMSLDEVRKCEWLKLEELPEQSIVDSDDPIVIELKQKKGCMMM